MPIVVELATLHNIDFAIDADRDFPTLSGYVDYLNGGSQGFALVIDTSFLIRLLYVFDARRLRQLENDRCYVRHDSERIYGFRSRDGLREFDIDTWRAWARERSDANVTMNEMRFGTARTARRPDDDGPRTRPVAPRRPAPPRGPFETALVDPPNAVSGPRVRIRPRPGDIGDTTRQRLDAMAGIFTDNAPDESDLRPPPDFFDHLKDET